jgi:hypothetical protein
MHGTNKDEVLTRDAGRITPNERWRSQQKTALAKLARSGRPDQQVEDLAEQMITSHSAVREAVRDLGAKLEGTRKIRLNLRSSAVGLSFVFFVLFLDRHSLGDVCCGYSLGALTA